MVLSATRNRVPWRQGHIFILCSFLAVFCIAGLSSRIVSWATLEVGCFCSEASFNDGKCCREHPSQRQCPGECVCPSLAAPRAAAENSTLYSFPEDDGDVTCTKKDYSYRGGLFTDVLVRALVILAALGLVGTLLAVCMIHANGYRNAPVVDKDFDTGAAEWNESFTSVRIAQGNSDKTIPPQDENKVNPPSDSCSQLPSPS